MGLGAVTTNGFYKYLAQASSTWENRSDYPPSGSQETYVQNLKSFGNGRLVYKDIVAAGSSFSVSTDGGFTWAQITPPGGSWVPVDADLCPDGKLWLAWYNRSGSPDLLRIYYLDPFGATSPQLADEVSIPSGAAAHDNGSVSCHPANASRIAVTVQNTWGAAVVVTTTGGGDGTWVVRNTGAVANAYRTVWSGSRLILVHDVSYWFRIRISDDDGQTWTETAAFSSVAGSEKGIDVIRTPVSGLVFSYIDDSTGGTDRVLRSIQNGDATTWVGAALPAGLSGSFTGPRAIGYDVENDDLYVASNSTSGTVYRLPNAGSRDWSTVTAADWVSIPTSGGRPGYRGFTVIKE